MGRLLKYELKNSRRFIIALICCLLLASLMFQININNIIEREDGLGSERIALPVMIITMLLATGASISFFFYVASLMTKELFRDRGYLTMTLPVDGFQIMGAKSLCAIIATIATGIIVIAFNIILINFIFSPDIVKEFWNVILDAKAIAILWRLALHGFVYSVLVYELIFSSIIFSKATVSKYRLGGLWFVMFMVLLGIYQWLTTKVVGGFYVADPVFSTVFGVGAYRDYSFASGYWPVVAFHTATALALYGLNSYMIQHKIDI